MQKMKIIMTFIYKSVVFKNCYCVVAFLITSHMALLLYMYRNKCTLRTFVDAIGKLFINL